MDHFKEKYPDFCNDPMVWAAGQDSADGLPEVCDGCKEEFIFEICGSDPPTVKTKCFCGKSIFTICTEEELEEFMS